MKSTDLKKIEKYKKEIARLLAVVNKQNRKLLALPAKHGYRSMDEFIAALKAAGSSGGAAPAGKAKASGGKTRKRAKITPEIKAQVKSLSGQGKTGAEIAKATGISVPSVANIKRELGLVKKRK
ncbi:MAG TPA: helix-turn-helix domain-containing protein [Lacunisphaera sp.]|nr:helix-turn-helix domain-containing protein [Lacunisphaera sp.]